MAKRSEFAQKLLDDLRLRKERLACSSQSSNSLNSSMAITDAYSYARQNYRGTKHIKPSDMINGSRVESRAKNWSIVSDKSSSQQIIPYNEIRDLSNETNSSFSSRAKTFPNYFSPSQIEEISRGIQRLNRILKGCSKKGVDFDRRLVQIGKELLKGAIDLENSLKMFSEKPEIKNQIKWLGEENEDDEEGNVNLAKEWELNRPRFCFDNEAEGIVRRTGFVQRQKEKKRIPNVIAKLMGLEKLPEENVEEDEEDSVRVHADSKKPAAQAKPFVVNTSFVLMVNERPKKIETKREKKKVESSNSISRSLKQNSRVTKQKPREPNSAPQEKLKRNKNFGKCIDSKQEFRRSFNNNNNNVQKSWSKNELTRARSTRQQSSVVREVKPARREKVRVKGSEAKGQRVVIVKEADKIVVTSPKRPETLVINDEFSQNVRNDVQLNHETFCEDRELKCCVVANTELDETIDTLSKTEPEPNNIEKTTSIQTITEKTTAKPAEPIIITLTEAESQLKQIFLKSQLFLSTAGALFELEIPYETLHSATSYQININEQINNNNNNNSINNNNNDEKLMLDCGFELMRRKGRRQELSVHPNYDVTKQKTVRINSFECLVRELSEDFEKLRAYGRDHGSRVEEYLAGMQESDVAGKRTLTDVNCMWDLGWNDTVFAFVEVDEVVKELEKFLFNYLLDQIIASDFYFYY